MMKQFSDEPSLIINFLQDGSIKISGVSEQQMTQNEKCYHVWDSIILQKSYTGHFRPSKKMES